MNIDIIMIRGVLIMKNKLLLFIEIYCVLIVIFLISVMEEVFD